MNSARQTPIRPTDLTGETQSCWRRAITVIASRFVVVLSLIALLSSPRRTIAADHPDAARPATAPNTHSAKPAASNATKDAKTSSAPSEKSSAAEAPSPPATETDELNPDALAAKIKQLKDATDDAQPDRAKLLELYRAALDDVQAAADIKSGTEKLVAEHAAASKRVEELEKQLAAPAAQVAPLPKNKDLSAWEALLDQAEHDQSAADEKAKQLDDEADARSARRLELPQAIADARQKLDDAKDTTGKDSAADDSTADDSADVKQTRQLAGRAHRRLLQSQLDELEKEQQSFDESSSQLLDLEQQLAHRAASEAQARASQWRDAINDRRQAEADRQAAEAHSDAAKVAPALKSLADETAALADRRKDLTKEIDGLSDDTQSVADRLDKLTDQFKQATEKFQNTGLTNALGQLLRKQRSDLKAIDADRAAIHDRQTEVTAVQAELSDLDEQLAQLRDLDAATQEVIAAIGVGSGIKPADVRALLKTKRQYLNALATDENDYYGALVELNSKQQQLVTLGQKYRAYIEEKVLWIPSTHSPTLADAKKALAAGAWVLKPANWWQTVVALTASIQSNFLLSIFTIAVIVAWAVGRKRLRKLTGLCANRTDADSSNGIAINSTDSPGLGRTLAALLATLLVAGCWPAALWSLASAIGSYSSADQSADFAAALAPALFICAGILLPLCVIREICRRHGLGENYFAWPADGLAQLRSQTGILIAAGLPLVLVLATLASQSNDAWKNSLGRLLFVLCQLVLVHFAIVTLRRPHGSLYRLMALDQGGWMPKLALSILLACVAIPLALSGLAIAGYFFTAIQLACRLEATMWWVLGLVVAHAIASRWLSQLANQAAAAHPQRAIAVQDADDDSLPFEQDSQPALDVSQHAAENFRLLHSVTLFALAVAMWLVWADVLPALRLLDQVTLWTNQIDATHSDPVSLADLLEATAIAALTILAAADLPPLLERVLLHRLPLDAGLRYALSAVVRYVVAIFGLAFAGGAIGIGWPKMQWLMAAVSFGLGFGLQEIFANFVSGLIIFWERPVRIGDTVTVDDMTGVVSRIQMRATTILDPDRKELIVPNKEFITSHVVNWTLSDSVVRLVLPVNWPIATDPQLVQRMLMRIANENAAVLKHPPAKVALISLGDKALSFELRVFVADVDSLMTTRHQLNMAIDRALRTPAATSADKPAAVKELKVA